jgi:hypothetical protein
VLAAVVAGLQLASGTSARDLVAFGAYAVLALVLPGTLLWRLLRPTARRLWLEDVVFGAVLGYAVEVVCYIAARAVGAPLLVLAWPVAVYGICLLTRRGRAVWRPAGVEHASARWSWGIAGVLTYLVLFVARANWWESGLSPGRLRQIGADASFQLAMTGELRHHVPPTVPWVAGEPLHYHWLTYAHTAAATWATGIEPIVMLRRLAPLLMAILVVLAVALIARRLTDRAGAGLLAAGLLVLVHSPAFYSAETDHFQRQEFASQAIFGSPTMTFGLALSCGVLLLALEVLRGQLTFSTWPMLVLLLAVTSGAKATFAPMVAAGALAVVAIGILTRSVAPRHLALLGVSVVSWMVFQFGFYAGEGTGFRLSARGTLEFAAASFGSETPSATSLAGLSLAVTILLLWGVHMAGMLGLLPEGGWRDPAAVFLWGLTLSGLGAGLLLDLGLASQQWFVTSTLVAAAVGAAWGLQRLVPTGSYRELVPVACTAALLGAAGMAVGWAISSDSVPPLGRALPRLWSYAAPALVTVAALAALAIVFAVLPSRQPGWRVALVFLCAGLTGMGLFRTTQLVLAMAQVPWQRSAPPAAASVTIGPGGVAAARWLREHSSPDELVATNGHALTPDSDLQLAFWLAGYGERRVLVESWGYTTHHARIMASTGLDFDAVPFWDQQLLRDNDRAFTDPSVAAFERLRSHYDVSWLMLDRRFPSDPAGMSQVLQPVFTAGDYAVYRIG